MAREEQRMQGSAHRLALNVLALLALVWPLAATEAQPLSFCAKPFADHVRETICSNWESQRSEWSLQTQIHALKELLADFEFEELEKAQVQWNRERQRICEAEPTDQKAVCYGAQAGNRTTVLQRQVVGAFKGGTASLSLGDAVLDVRWRVDKEIGTVVTQLRHGDKILTEIVGADRFDEVARAGNAEAEAVVIHSRKRTIIFVIVHRKEMPPEIWRYWPSRFWMEKPPIVEAKGELLRLKEQAEKPKFGDGEVESSAIVEWTPSAGWTVVQSFRMKAVVPKGRQFDGRTTPGEVCKTPFEGASAVRLGGRTLTAGKKSLDRDYNSDPFGPYVLAFGCDLLIGGFGSGINLEPERRVDGASVMLSTESDGGNGGFVRRHILADVPGHGIEVWPFPMSESGAAGGDGVIATSFGFLFLTPASPGTEGGVYRWSPSVGFTFDGYRPFMPHAPMLNAQAVTPGENPLSVSGSLFYNAEVYRAFATAAGPSVIGRSHDLSGLGSRIDRQFAPDMVVFDECDGSRFCNHSRGRTIGIFKPATRNFYFAFRQDPMIFFFGGTEPSQPSVWEFHPPLELWPEDAAKVIETLRQGDVVLK